MECENFFPELDYEVVLPASLPAIPDPIMEAEQIMLRKYGVGREFIDTYVKFAAERSGTDIVRCNLLLPPNCGDSLTMQRKILECAKVLEKHDSEYESRRSAAVAEMAKIGAEKARATSEKEKNECEAKSKAVTMDYCDFAAKSWKALQILNECSKLKPINATEFHTDMQNFSRMVIGLKIKMHFPELGDSIL